MPRMLWNKKNKAVLAVASVLLILALSVGGTVAYILARSDYLRNIFSPAEVDCLVVYAENGNATVQNTGDAPAYIRAALVINWMGVDENGHPLEFTHASSPVEGTDYTVEYSAASEGWVKSATSGFWYYTKPVAPGESTPPLVIKITPLTTPPKGYGLMSGMVSSAIQCDPATVVETYWNVEVDHNGVVTPN